MDGSAYAEDTARRFLIYAHVQQIPGPPNARPWNIWHIFCKLHLQRAAKLDPSQSFDDLDVVHVLPGYDSENDRKAWFLTDVGVKKEESGVPDVASLPHDVYLAHFDPQDSEWTFVGRPGLTEGYRDYFKRWPWGSKTETDRDKKTDRGL